MTIQLLPADVAAKIAAGEVVERPANVAKELIENSLDARATEIRIEIRDGGQRLLRVTDNGVGMSPAEAPLAFERHATSKLRTADDLTRISTFGFRGEALYSIAAVSRVTLISCAAPDAAQPGADAVGTRLRIEGGRLVEQSRVGTPPGTILSIENIFYNMPARQKFLRRPATEAGRISAVVQRYALAYPQHRFSFVNNGKLVFQSTGSGDLFDVLVKLYGLENAKQMVPVGATRSDVAEHAQPGPEADIDFMADRVSGQPPPAVEHQPLVSGYASLPTLTRANRSNIDLFVNRRYVEDRSLTYAVIQAYHTLLPGGRYPIGAIFVSLDPTQVDVNVHPQKTQVRFVEERRVYGAVQKAVRRAIVDGAPVPGMTLSSGQDQTGAFDPFQEMDTWAPGSEWVERRRNLVNAGQQPSLDFSVSSSADSPVPEPQQKPTDGSLIPQEVPSTEEEPVASAAPRPDRSALSKQPGAPAQGSEASEKGSKLPPLRVVGQVGAMYIVTEGPEGLFLIDQHAAHERILYERLMSEKYAAEQKSTEGMEGAAGKVASQTLLEPLTLHAGRELTGYVAQFLQSLNQFGFEVEPFGGDTFLVRAVPAVLSDQDPLRVLEEIVSGLRGGRNIVGEELEARLVKMICKRASIKAGQVLSDIEMQELIHQLESCQSPRTCPHGRPTMIQLSAGELEKAFGRV